MALADGQGTLNAGGTAGTPPTNPGQMVLDFYKFALIAGAILAFGAIVYGAIRHVLSAGNPSGKSDAKEWIREALLGLALLVGAYIILNTINPNLVNLTLPGLQQVTAPTSTVTDSGVCGNLTIIPCPSSDSFCLAMEGGATTVWSSADPNVNLNLSALRAAVDAMRSVVSSNGGSMTVTSVYRPIHYQMHLYSIYQASLHYNSNMALYDGNPDCASYVTQLTSEEGHHGICYGSHPCLASPASGCASHTNGTGVDIVLSGISYDSINALLSSNHINLRWPNLGGDRVHFNLKSPPYTGCATE